MHSAGRESVLRVPGQVGIPAFAHREVCVLRENVARNAKYKDLFQIYWNQGWLSCLEQTSVEFFSLQRDKNYVQVPRRQGPTKSFSLQFLLIGRASSRHDCHHFFLQFFDWVTILEPEFPRLVMGVTVRVLLKATGFAGGSWVTSQHSGADVLPSSGVDIVGPLRNLDTFLPILF